MRFLVGFCLIAMGLNLAFSHPAPISSLQIVYGATAGAGIGIWLWFC